MCNNSYRSNRYTVGTLMCDVDSSGSMGEGGHWLAALSTNQRTETPRRVRERERGDVGEEGKEVEQAV